MKIAMVFDNMIYGGIERVGINYVKLIKHMGHDVDAYVLNPATEGILEELQRECNTYILDYKRSYAPEFYRALNRKFKWGKFVSPIVCGVMNLCLPLFKKKYSVPGEYDIAIAFSGHVNDLTFVCEDFVKADSKVVWLHGNENEYLKMNEGFGTLYAKIKNLVCLSDAEDDEVAEFNKNNNIRKIKIYNPVNIKDAVIDEQKVENLKNEYGDFCLMVARLANDKDQITAIKAVKEMNEKYSLNKKLLLAGDGPNRDMLEKFVAQESVSDNVVFLGNCSDVQNYYKAASVYVHSSPLEGLPTVLIEAMAFDLPIVSTDSYPGVREILGDCEYGLISPVGDYEALAENIYRVYSDKELYDKYALLSSNRFNDFTFEAAKANLEELFKVLTEK